jgi:S-(hydroxymethyl)glutathione dehydrogenase/alcohol dehydrogenase
MKAAILEKIRAPLTVADINFSDIIVPKLHSGQVFVRVLCTGICGSQLQEIDGLKGNPANLPHLLGHEGCGIVEGVHPDVTTVKEGNKVVMHWRKGEGIEAEPARYSRKSFMNPSGPMANGYVDSPVKAGPITTFSEYAIVSENRVTTIPQDTPDDLACLLGCCLSTAMAIVENEAVVDSESSVFVIGCGGLGLAIIIALKACGVINVLAHDQNDKKKAIVEELGAKFLYNQASGFDLVIDTTGQYEHLASGRYISLQKGGTSAGGFNPSQDIPRYVANPPVGWEKLITHRISLDKINDGIRLMRQGRAGRVMIDFT